MAVNNFLSWANGSNANVLSQAQYSAMERGDGVVSGRASAQQANKVWRQSSLMTSMIGQFIVDRLNVNAVDDGTIATLETDFIAAIRSVFSIANTGVVPGTYGPTMTLAVQADGRITSLVNAPLTPTGITAGTYVGTTVTVGVDGRITGISGIPYGAIGGANAWTGTNRFSGIDASGTGGQLRVTNANYGSFIRNDGSSTYLMSTASGQAAAGGFNALRPFSWHMATGVVTIDGTGAGATFGGLVTAANDITITNGDFLALAGSVTASALISAGGNVIAGGSLKAGVGAFGSLEGATGTILNDFFRTTNGNGGYSFQRLPNGYIIQTNTINTVSGNGETVTFPVAFPNGCANVYAIDGSPSTWDDAGPLQPTVFATQGPSTTGFLLTCVKWAQGSGTFAYAANVPYRYIAIGW